MRHLVFMSAIALSAVLVGPAYADVGSTNLGSTNLVLIRDAIQSRTAAQVGKHKRFRNAHVATSASHTVTYNRDSPNPNIGWHNDGSGMRVCHQDCDNPEIPGSGYACRDVNIFGMTTRECDWSSW